MSERLYYINNQWVTYEQAHNEYGYTNSRPEFVTFLRDDFSEVTVRKDVDDNTFYDIENHAWYEDINEFSPTLYRQLDQITLYKCESSALYNCYTDTVKNDDPKFVSYDFEMTSLDDLYNNYGMTQYRCAPYIVNEGIVIAWYDGIEELYWNDREGYKRWQLTAPVPESPPVDASDFDILNIDMRPALDQYIITEEQLSDIDFMKIYVDIDLDFIDGDVQSCDVFNLPVYFTMQLYTNNVQLQLLSIKV